VTAQAGTANAKTKVKVKVKIKIKIKIRVRVRVRVRVKSKYGRPAASSAALRSASPGTGSTDAREEGKSVRPEAAMPGGLAAV